MEESTIEDVENISDLEVAPALIAVHPLEESVAVAVGSHLRVFDLKEDRAVALLDSVGGLPHIDAIRAICFCTEGRFLVSAGDDKLVKVWATEYWHCIKTVCSEKRVSAVAISHDDNVLTFADKFGVIWMVDLDTEAMANAKPVPVFAHYCSIITSLEFSPNGQYIVSADRDFKIRVTMFPKRPSKGVHEIQSFCLGHTDFISCIAFVRTKEDSQGFLLSGGGDSTVRMWDFTSGCLLFSCAVGQKAVSKAEFVPLIGEEDCSPVVTDLCASSDGSLVAVALQSFCGIVLLTCDLSAKSLEVTKVVSFQERFMPTSLGMSSVSNRLWMVTGASNLPSCSALPLACVRVISDLNLILDSHGPESVVLEDEVVPGGEKLLQRLQGSVNAAKEEKALTEAAEAVKVSMRNLFIKKQYSAERREFRKRGRNDKKIKH